MNVTVSGRHMEVTPAIRDYVESGIKKLKAHFERVIDVDVTLSVEKHRHKAEFNLHAHGLRINATERSEDMYTSIDAALAKLDRQVSKHKSRIMRHQPRTTREERSYDHHIIEMPESMADNGHEDEPATRHKVIHRESLDTKPMSVDEATLQLELLDERFLVFSNADTQQVNVIYARDDGTYGLIEPKF